MNRRADLSIIRDCRLARRARRMMNHTPMASAMVTMAAMMYVTAWNAFGIRCQLVPTA